MFGLFNKDEEAQAKAQVQLQSAVPVAAPLSSPKGDCKECGGEPHQGGEECDECHSRKWCTVKTTDKVAYTWSRRGCGIPGHPLPVDDGTISMQGYAVPFCGKLKAITWTFNKGVCNGVEQLLVQINGQTVETIEINPTSSDKGCLWICHDIDNCDTINIISTADQGMEYDSVCGLVVTVIVECEKNIRIPKPPKVCPCTIFEAYTGYSDPHPDFPQGVWIDETFAHVRTDIDPDNVISYNSVTGEVTLLAGVYTVHYQGTFSTQTSANPTVDARLEVDTGAGYLPYEGSEMRFHDFSANNGGGNFSSDVTLTVPFGGSATMKVTAFFSVDSYTGFTGSKNILVNRVCCVERPYPTQP